MSLLMVAISVMMVLIVLVRLVLSAARLATWIMFISVSSTEV